VAKDIQHSGVKGCMIEKVFGIDSFESLQRLLEMLPVRIPQGPFHELADAIPDKSKDFRIGASRDSQGLEGPIHGTGQVGPRIGQCAIEIEDHQFHRDHFGFLDLN
jgi:hypothetical protein